MTPRTASAPKTKANPDGPQSLGGPVAERYRQMLPVNDCGWHLAASPHDCHRAHEEWEELLSLGYAALRTFGIDFQQLPAFSHGAPVFEARPVDGRYYKDLRDWIAEVRKELATAILAKPSPQATARPRRRRAPKG